MNVASKEICKELYELSGWRDVDYWYSRSSGALFRPILGENKGIPAYTLDYILRRLPRVIEPNFKDRLSQLTMTASNVYGYGFNYPWTGYNSHSQSPENAACTLLVELLKSGVLANEPLNSKKAST